MFAILDSDIEGAALLVYNSLTFIIGIFLDERRTQTAGMNLKPVLDTYISQHFVGTMAHKHMMKCLKNSLEDVESKSQVSKLIATFKVRSHSYIVTYIRYSLLNIFSNLSFNLDLLTIGNNKASQLPKIYGSRKISLMYSV